MLVSVVAAEDEPGSDVQPQQGSIHSKTNAAVIFFIGVYLSVQHKEAKGELRFQDVLLIQKSRGIFATCR